MNVPGTGPMNEGRVGMFGTGLDIPQTSPNTQITEGDLLDIVIFDTPDLSGRFRVNLKGDILLPLAGTLHVAGMTLSEITEAVAQRYKDAKILIDPQVTVFVAEFNRRTITITGEVRAPGVYSITAPRTLTDTLAMAGGLNDSASRTVSIVHAANPKEIVHVTLNVGAQTPESIEQGRMEILPGDSIFVARSGVIYVVGELVRPGGYQVEHNNRLTLLEAVALAGGLTRNAKASQLAPDPPLPDGQGRTECKSAEGALWRRPGHAADRRGHPVCADQHSQGVHAANHRCGNRFSDDVWHLSRLHVLTKRRRRPRRFPGQLISERLRSDARTSFRQ